MAGKPCLELLFSRKSNRKGACHKYLIKEKNECQPADAQLLTQHATSKMPSKQELKPQMSINWGGGGEILLKQQKWSLHG